MKRSRLALLVAWIFASGVSVRGARRPAEIMFESRMIDPGAFETAAIGDVNRDGHPDIVAGENWYEGPRWIKHTFRSIEYF